MGKFAFLFLGAVSAFAGSFTLSNTTAGNFDSSFGTRTVTVTGAEPGFGSGTISSIVISINFAKADGEAFAPPFPAGTPFYNEIVFRLTGPSTTEVTLIEANSWGAGSGQFDGTITFDQSAPSVVNFGAAPVAGTFRPTGAGSLSDFLSQSALGVWTLSIQDTVAADSLRFRNFDLTINTDRSTVPEPGSIVLMSLGLVALGARRYRRA
jgi:hypothetical protein